MLLRLLSRFCKAVSWLTEVNSLNERKQDNFYHCYRSRHSSWLPINAPRMQEETLKHRFTLH